MAVVEERDYVRSKPDAMAGIKEIIDPKTKENAHG